MHLKTDYVDLIFIHAVGDHDFKTEVEWPKSKEFKETAEAIRKSGKARFVGFSTHHHNRAEILQARGRRRFRRRRSCFRTTPGSPRTGQKDEINRALDACHKAGIGLISMKQVAGNMNLDEDRPSGSRASRKRA